MDAPPCMQCTKKYSVTARQANENGTIVSYAIAIQLHIIHRPYERDNDIMIWPVVDICEVNV